MRLLLSRQYGYLATLNIHVHRESAWAVALDWSWRERRYQPRKPVRFHTTQDRVWLDGVADKQQKIRRGFAPVVTVTNADEFGANDLWICNGHHTLAAYLDLGRIPNLRWFERAAVSSGYRVRVPRFDSTATR